jgi:hypothetical protein
MPTGFQIIFRALDDRRLASTAGQRRAFAETIKRIGKSLGLVSFGMADTHGHATLFCERSQAGRFAHDLKLALAALFDCPMATLAIKELRDTWHLQNTVRYTLRQDEHHGVHDDRAREATSLPDFCGLRPSGLWMAQRARELLPRLTRAHLLEDWGLSELIPSFSLATLAEAGAAAAGTGSLEGLSAAQTRAKVACVHLASDEDTRDVAAALGIHDRTVQRLRKKNPDNHWIRAISLQMGLLRSIGIEHPDAALAALSPFDSMPSPQRQVLPHAFAGTPTTKITFPRQTETGQGAARGSSPTTTRCGF